MKYTAKFVIIEFSPAAIYKYILYQGSLIPWNVRFKCFGGQRLIQMNFALETFGDSWSLLILRDIVYFGKKTFGEFLDSDEGISTNILATVAHDIFPCKTPLLF